MKTIALVLTFVVPILAAAPAEAGQKGNIKEMILAGNHDFNGDGTVDAFEKKIVAQKPGGAGVKPKKA